MKADDYLAHAAQARACYVALFEAATIALPILVTGEHNVECHYTARDLTAKLPGRSASVVANEIRWLVNNGWIMVRSGSSVRFLGRRVEGVFHLLADVVAHQATGEDRLVTRRILNISLPGAPVTAETAKRGAARQWDGDVNGLAGGSLVVAPQPNP